MSISPTSSSSSSGPGTSKASSAGGGETKRTLGKRMEMYFARALRGPSVSHSILFGMAAGYYAYRAIKLTFFDTESIALQSRLRYAEKQKIFQQELDRDLAAGHIASLVAEYNPIAIRLPFQPLDDKYRI